MSETCMLEDVFSSKGRVRVIRVLAKAEELNISEIARRANLNYRATNNHLKALRNAGLIQEKRFGRVRIFRFKSENTKALALKQLVEAWET
ncbi:MAG: winged helix-turn-helix domain-containing protein [Candidatus Jordarchaeales archaeon]|nr:winged helix-turn-helix transcriptional regulator [Candidatus Jordarchaeia archaeon]